MAAIQTPTLIQPNEVVNGGVLKPTPINARFDVTLIAPHIGDAESIHVVPVLGQDFYDALILKKAGAISNYNTAIGAVVKGFPASGDAALETLWQTYLLPLCGWAVYYEALPFITMQAGANGVFTADVQYGTNVGADGVKFLQDTALRRLKSLAARTLAFLCKNADDYTDFDSATLCKTDCDGTTKPIENTDTVGNLGLFYVTDGDDNPDCFHTHNQ
jgi:hypothetical protein